MTKRTNGGKPTGAGAGPPGVPDVDLLDVDKVRQLREEKGLSQAQAAERAGWKNGAPQWNDIEKRKGRSITLSTLARLCRALECKPTDLMLPLEKGEPLKPRPAKAKALEKPTKRRKTSYG